MEAFPGREGQLDLVLWSERIRAVIAGDTLIDEDVPFVVELRDGGPGLTVRQ
jgi:hypothetical protein